MKRVHRGIVLLECLVALAALVMGGLVIFAVCDAAASSIEASRDKARAADIARSAMAKLESGLESAESLNGGTGWTSGDSSLDGPAGDTTPRGADGGWSVRIETEPARFAGWSVVSVRAFKTTASGRESASFTLRQMISLTGRPREGAKSGSVALARTPKGSASVDGRIRGDGP